MGKEMEMMMVDNQDDEAVKLKCCWKFDPAYNRFIALFYLCSFGFLICVTYDMPGSLESQIESTFSIQPYQFEYLYSVYSSPNVILCFFGGILIDRYLGVKRATLLLAAFSLVGQIIITVGAFTKIYWLMLLGRFVYGLGGESMEVAISYYAIMWFAGKELNFVFGILACVARLGTSFVYLISYPLYQYFKKHGPKGAELGSTVSIGIPMFVVVFALLLILAWESKKNGKNVGKAKSTGGGEEKIRFRDILRFSSKFWLVSIVQTSFTSAVYVFVSCSQELLINKYKYSTEKANEMGSLFNIIGALSAPVPGLIIDKVGRELYFTIGGLALGIVSQVIQAFTQWNPLVSIIMFAVSFSTLNSCTWPLTALVVEQYQMGTAIGTTQSIMNLCLTVSTIFAGFLLGRFGYMSACLFYLAYLVIGFICAIVLWFMNRKDENGILNMSASQKRIQREQIKKSAELKGGSKPTDAHSGI